MSDGPRSLQTAIAGLGGLAATLVDIATLTILVESGVAIAAASLLGACAGAAVSFTFNRRIAFRDRSSLRWQQLAIFAAVALTSGVAMAVAMEISAVVLGVPYLLAKLICSVLVFCLWSLPAQRRFVFPRPFDATVPSSSSF